MPNGLRNVAQFAVAALLGVTLASCDMPHDPEMTTSLVRETHTIRLGWIEGAERDEHVTDVLSRLRRKTDANVEVTRGDSENLLPDLATGKLDLVYGTLPKDSPWSKEVYFGRALGWRASPPSHEPVSRFVMRNGENEWIMLVENAARP